MPKGELNPNPTDRWVRDTLVEDRREMLQQRGVDASSRDIEEQVKRDLILADKINTEQRQKPKPEKPAYRPTDPAGDAAKESGAEFYKASFDAKAPIAQQRCPMCNGHGTMFNCKFCALQVRMALLMARGSLGSKNICGDRLRGIDFLHPKYAQEILELHVHYQIGSGPFRDIPRKYSHGMLLRKMEDICDRSNAIPGLPNWWTK